MLAGKRGLAVTGQSARHQGLACTPTSAHRGCRRCVVAESHKQDWQPFKGESCDVVLSSGFLAFASHSGFLQGVEDAGIRVSGVMGTSAGALTGSLYAAGYTPSQAAAELSRVPPINFLRPSLEPWKGGLLTMDGVIEKLRDLLPPTFEDLEKEFAVGVVNSEGEHLIIDSGPLPEAVVASAAIPFIFCNVNIPGLDSSLKDGGVVDRVGLKAWRDRRRRLNPSYTVGNQPLPAALVHIIERSSPFSGCDDAAKAGEQAVHIVRSPKSGVSFFDLGEFSVQFNAARQRSRTSIEVFRTTGIPSSSSGGNVPRSNVVPAPAAIASAASSVQGATTSSTSGSSSSLAGAPSSPSRGVVAAGNGRVKVPVSVVAASSGSSGAGTGVVPRAQAANDA